MTVTKERHERSRAQRRSETPVPIRDSCAVARPSTQAGRPRRAGTAAGAERCPRCKARPAGSKAPVPLQGPGAPRAAPQHPGRPRRPGERWRSAPNRGRPRPAALPFRRHLRAPAPLPPPLRSAARTAPSSQAEEAPAPGAAASPALLHAAADKVPPETTQKKSNSKKKLKKKKEKEKSRLPSSTEHWRSGV
ncbi:translation initiation factor IF-2-like isoform X1 [Pyrgilauda ruficollis]|uniref:translation initiation factor IF-2-like isoform X1 n=1 Tax=Pyrgilauda ruficollis TaxID=221976 RepID=UPI001B881820|nr:translation initiation factor IF-2-like isoform X1 [Pyrgilauda ruficollis]